MLHSRLEEKSLNNAELHAGGGVPLESPTNESLMNESPTIIRSWEYVTGFSILMGGGGNSLE